jgi:ankyrin repeat protein
MSDEYLNQFLKGLRDLAQGFEDASEVGPQTRSRVGDTPLHIAVIQGDVRAIKLLLDAGADIHALGETGYTALHYAVAHGRPEAVRALLERGADTQLCSGIGETPNELAQHFDNDEIKTLLHGRLA